jgi:SpoVK/Ycf46/Vps4 family AAA+-type ATPase
VLGTFLSWMQDRKAPVFVAATSNNVESLPPELIRKGRFDEIFFVDLPSDSERQVILKLHLGRRKRNPAEFDLPKLVAASAGFSGAEIEAAVQSGLYAAFAEKKPLRTEHIVKVLEATVPLSQTREEDIRRLRNWARERAVAASSVPGQASAGLGFAR